MGDQSAIHSLPKELCVVWLRNDLRVNDNPALFYASKVANAKNIPLVCVYFITPKQWELHSESPAKLGLTHGRLTVLQKELAEYKIPLIVLQSDCFNSLSKDFCQFFSGKNLQGVWVNHQYGLNEKRLDQCVKDSLYETFNCPLHSYHGELILAPGEVLTQQQTLYQVFTPFSKAWYNNLTSEKMETVSPPAKQAALSWQFDQEIPSFGGTFRDDIWPVDTKAIHGRLEQFIEKSFSTYPDKRDIPSLRGTSVLSAYLAIGALGVRECLSAIRMRYPEDVWVQHQWPTELVWREFYRHWLSTAPRLSQGKSFKPAGDKVQWRTGEQADRLFHQWCEGKTGFPIVDAGMRQLKQTGWMHNRLRMVTASFLSKLLLIDWRKGETFFMQHLIDGDFASNNGGWQWAASVGADAAPYFRIFNPYRQSERFDKDGVYIRRFVPELKTLVGKSIHQPTSSEYKRLNYPEPIIDYSQSRKISLNHYEIAFKN